MWPSICPPMHVKRSYLLMKPLAVHTDMYRVHSQFQTEKQSRCPYIFNSFGDKSPIERSAGQSRQNHCCAEFRLKFLWWFVFFSGRVNGSPNCCGVIRVVFVFYITFGWRDIFARDFCGGWLSMLRREVSQEKSVIVHNYRLSIYVLQWTWANYGNNCCDNDVDTNWVTIIRKLIIKFILVWI